MATVRSRELLAKLELEDIDLILREKASLVWTCERSSVAVRTACFVLFDLILYVHSTIFQLCGTSLPGLNKY